jgi:hypothetical protein
MKDATIDILQDLGYTGVPHRETASIGRMVQYVSCLSIFKYYYNVHIVGENCTVFVCLC